MRIASKAEMYALQKRGLLGNYLPTWTWDEFLAEFPEGNFGIRHGRVSGSPLFKRGFDRHSMLQHVNWLIISGKIAPEDVVISQDTTLYESCRTLQGEVSLCPELTFAYSGTVGNDLTCREEVRQPRLVTLTGLRAKLLLETFLDAPSQETLWRLLTEYPDSTIEFTSFSRGVGAFLHNTVFWECRTY